VKIKSALASILTIALFTAASAQADVFTLGPGSTLDFAGSLGLEIVLTGPSVPGGSVTFTGSGPITPAKPGSLHSDLTGTLNASSNGSSLSFLGGSAIHLANPDAFGFNVNVPLSGPVSGFSLQMSAKMHNLELDVKGTAPLSGPPGSQTFDTNGLQWITTAGVFDGTATACVPACQAPSSFSFSIADPGNPDLLFPGTGSLLTQNGITTVSFPVVYTNTTPQTIEQDVQGTHVKITVTPNTTFSGAVIAAVPEPASWVLITAGLLGLAAFVRRRAALLQR
jgi:hypothetical protein